MDKMKLMKSIFLFSAIFISIASIAEAAPVPPGQGVGATTRTEIREKQGAAIKEKITRDDGVVIEGEEKIREEQKVAATPDTGPKVLIEKIVVEGSTLLTDAEIRAVVAPHEGKELSLSDFQSVAASITDEYRSKGLATSFAYVPPQQVTDKTLRISVSEGKVGNVVITGNKYFGTDLLLRYLDTQKGQYFNYDSIRENIRRMNARPDVNGRVILNRGEAPGETDVEVQVKDRLPWHVTLGYNNYNSDFLEKNKFSAEVKSTNFTNNGDIFSVEAQFGEADRYQLYSGRYLYPVTDRLSAGVYYIHVDQALGRSLGDFKITGEGDVANAYLSYKLVEGENFSMNINPAFEYNNFTNDSDGTEISEDDVRIAKIAFDVDFSDRFGGRNLISNEFDFGIPDFMGSMDSVVPTGASRPNAEGEFFRAITNAARIQRLPWSTVLLLKTSSQLSGDNLPGSEQFQIGGFYTVRGYPVSEKSGDSGIAASVEWHIPPYFIPKDYKIPYNSASVQESITLFPFFDFGYVNNNSPQVGETENEELYSAGVGLRFNLPNSMSVSFDYGWALGQEASDGAGSRGYIETKLFF